MNPLGFRFDLFHIFFIEAMGKDVDFQRWRVVLYYSPGLTLTHFFHSEHEYLQFLADKQPYCYEDYDAYKNAKRTYITTATPHKHAAVIHQYAEGHKVQYKRVSDGLWEDLNDSLFAESRQYRVRPGPIVVKYRRFVKRVADSYRVYTLPYHSPHESPAFNPEQTSCFVGWIDKDWISSSIEVL